MAHLYSISIFLERIVIMNIIASLYQGASGFQLVFASLHHGDSSRSWLIGSLGGRVPDNRHDLEDKNNIVTSEEVIRVSKGELAIHTYVTMNMKESAAVACHGLCTLLVGAGSQPARILDFGFWNMAGVGAE